MRIVARKPRRRRTLLILILLAVAVIRWQGEIRSWFFPPADPPFVEAPPAASGRSPSPLPSAAQAWAANRTDVQVAAAGEVIRLLPDDQEGSRHQRFVIRLDSGGTLLVVHNIDLAPRVPVEIGDTVELEGEFEWNDKGGLVHWTHHDPDRRHPDGWIQHQGKQYW